MLYAFHPPGWRWTQHSQDPHGPELCPRRHVGYLVSGRLGVSAADGSESEISPGDVFEISPGHDGWVIGDEACVLIAFAALTDS